MAYITTSELKTYLGVTGTGDDTLLGALITAAQKAVESFCRRRFEATTATRYYTLDDTMGQTLYLDDDLLTVTKLVNGDGVEITNDQYVLLPRNSSPKYAIQLLSGHSWVQEMDTWIEVKGTWGFSATAPADVVQATKRWAGYLYRQKDATTYDVTAYPEAGVISVPQGIPRDVQMLLAPYRKEVMAWA